MSEPEEVIALGDGDSRETLFRPIRLLADVRDRGCLNRSFEQDPSRVASADSPVGPQGLRKALTLASWKSADGIQQATADVDTHIAMQESIRNPFCRDCALHETCRTVCVVGDGPPSSRVVLIGEAPGALEDELGRPFVGESGERLNEALAVAGLTREEVVVTNVVKCRPPSNREPTATERRACQKYLDRELERVQPDFILLLGETALTLVNEQGVERNRGRVFDFAGARTKVTFHPGARLPDQRAKFREDIAEFVGWVQEYRDAQVAGAVESFASVCGYQQNCARPTRYVLRLALPIPDRLWWKGPIRAVCEEHVAVEEANGWRRILGPL